MKVQVKGRGYSGKEQIPIGLEDGKVTIGNTYAHLHWSQELPAFKEAVATAAASPVGHPWFEPLRKWAYEELFGDRVTPYEGTRPRTVAMSCYRTPLGMMIRLQDSEWRTCRFTCKLKDLTKAVRLLEQSDA